MKKTILTTTLILISILSLTAQDITKEALCKKWYISHYKYLWKKYDPEAIEKNDYIFLKSDMTFISVDGGEKSTGRWTFNTGGKYVQLYNKDGENLKLEIEEITNTEFVFEIDDEEMKGLEIHYSSTKKH